MNQLPPPEYPHSTQIHPDQCAPFSAPENAEASGWRWFHRFDSPPDEKMTPQWVAAQEVKRQALKLSDDQ